jgi:hypothetical protein
MIGNMYYFEVTGAGQFPHKLLSDQHCFPEDAEDAVNAFERIGSKRTIKLKGLTPPNVDVWRSYGWSMICFSHIVPKEDYTIYHTWPC